MKYRMCIFDLDGTLLDTLQDIAGSINTVLERYGLPVHTVDKYKEFVGEGMTVLVRKALPVEYGDSFLIGKCIDEMKTEYASSWMKNSKPYRDIDDLLMNIKKTGLKMAVLSNKPHQFTVEMVEFFFGKTLFDMVLGAGSFPPKPDPAGAIHIADSLKVAPSDIILIGDSAVDMKTAKAAGFSAAGVLWGFREREELVLSGADAIVSNPLEILSHLS